MWNLAELEVVGYTRQAARERISRPTVDDEVGVRADRDAVVNDILVCEGTAVKRVGPWRDRARVPF